MYRNKLILVVISALILSGCGGGSSDEAPAKPQFNSQVSFGDSLSDVGSYKVGVVATLGGGQFTINSTAGVPINWTEFIAPQFGLPAPCPAQTGIDNGLGTPDTPTSTIITVTNISTCTGYAQGGARVTNPVGIGNKLLPVDPGFALTVPVATQIANHLAANGGSFSGDEIVFVMAGANDVLIQLSSLSAGATAAATAAVSAQVAIDIGSGACVPVDLQASNCVAALTPTVGAAAANAYLATNSGAAVTSIGTASTELTGYVNSMILANGAKYVVVINVPDIASTPLAAGFDATTKGLVDTMVTTFNSTLQNAFVNNADVLVVDAYNASKDEVANPSTYNLTNVVDTACDLSLGVNPLATATSEGSSLACNSSNLAVGVSATNLFADSVHPTPYGHALFATYVLQEMVNKGWY